MGGVDGGARVDGGSADGTTKTPLWRNSYDRFCEKSASSWGAYNSVWTDDRGVFLLIRDANAGSDMLPSIRSNTGDGWQISYTWPNESYSNSGLSGLRGFVDGPLVAFGLLPCKIQLVDGNSAICSGAPKDISDVAVLSVSLAYAVYSDRVLRFDGSMWTQLGTTLPSNPSATARPYARGVWGDSSMVVVVANEGSVYLIDSAEKATLQNDLQGPDYTAVWGFASDDIWVGNGNGEIYHYDGGRWSLALVVPTEYGSVTKLWGHGGKLFVLAGRAFAEWDGSSFILRDSLSGNAFYQDIWGTSHDQVFMTVTNYDDQDCGTFQVRWFDGSVVGPL